MPSMVFTTDLGARVRVEYQGSAVAVMREYGRKGWTSGSVPRGGFVFPYANAEDFDWSVLGARPWRTPDGDAVIWRGQVFKKRVLAETSGRVKMPAAIKYSRGARPGDPPGVREKSGQFEYVTLVVFRGAGRKADVALPGGPS